MAASSTRPLAGFGSSNNSSQRGTSFGTARALGALNASVDAGPVHVEERVYVTETSSRGVTGSSGVLDTSSRAVTGTIDTSTRAVTASSEERRELAQAIVNAVCQYLGQLSFHEKHSEMLEAITNITVEPPDLEPVIRAIGETRANFDRVASKLDVLDHDVHTQRHAELIETITNIQIEAPNLTPIINAVNQSSGVLGVLEQRLRTMEKEVLQGQKHGELMEAITNITVEPPDLSPLRAMLSDIAMKIQAELPTMAVIGERLTLLEREVTRGQKGHGEVLEAISRIVVAPPDLRPVSEAIGRQLEAFAAVDARLKRLEESDALAGQQLAGLEERSAAMEATLHASLRGIHKELLDAIGNVVVQGPDLSPIHDELVATNKRQAVLDQKMQDVLGLNANIYRGQEDLKEAVLGIRVDPVDLSPVLKEIRGQADAQAKAIAQVDARLAGFEKGAAEQKRLLEAILQGMPQGLDKQMATLNSEVKKMGEAMQQELEVCQSGLTAEVATVRREVQELRKETGADAEMLQKEARMVPQASAEVLMKSLTPLLQQQTKDIFQALSQLGEPDPATVAAAVCERLKKMTLNMDSTEVLKFLRGMPELYAKMDEVHGKVSKSNIHYDPSDVLRSIGSMKLPTQEAIADLVIDRLRKTALKVDSTDVLKALSQLDFSVDVDLIASAVHEKLKKAGLKVDNTDIMQALRGFPDDETIAAAVMEKLKRSTLKVDQTDVLRAISSMRPAPDESLIADAVQEKLSKTCMTVAHHGEIMRAVKAVPAQLDFSPVLAQIEAYAVDLNPVMDAIAQSATVIDHTEVLTAIGGIPDHDTIADAVHERMCRTAFNVDQSDVLRALSKMKPAPETDEIAAAVHGRIQRQGVPVDHSLVLNAIASLPSHSDVADAVHERVMKTTVTVNHHAEMMRAIRAIPTEHDHDAIAAVVTDRIKKVNLSIDHTPVIKAIASLPDHDSIADAVHDKISRTTLNVDHSTVVSAINKINVEPDHGMIADAVHAKIARTSMTTDHHDQLIRAISTLPSHDDIAVAVHDRVLMSLAPALDTTELLNAVRRIPTEHDHDTTAWTVVERLQGTTPLTVDLSEVLQEIKKLKIQPDLSPVLHAIGGLDFSPIIDAIGRISMQVSVGGSMVASQSVSASAGASAGGFVPSTRLPLTAPSQASSSCGMLGARSQAAESPARDTSPRPSMMSASSPPKGGSEESPYRCMCGYSCGTPAALDRHMSKMSGSGGHARMG